MCGPKIAIIVDEAHGAHCYFHTEMPLPSLKGGADIAVVSTHKTLGSLLSTAMIIVSPTSIISASKVKDAYYLMNTSSPNMLLLSDVESAVVTMYNRGQEILTNALALSKIFKENVAKIPLVKVCEPIEELG